MISMLNSPCIICHDQGDVIKKNKLQQMEGLCRNFPATKESYSFNWGLHSHCKYGIYCQRLEQFDSECRAIALRIENKMKAASATDDKVYHELLELCRGDFPAVYHALEVIHHQKKGQQ